MFLKVSNTACQGQIHNINSLRLFIKVSKYCSTQSVKNKINRSTKTRSLLNTEQEKVDLQITRPRNVGFWRPMI